MPVFIKHLQGRGAIPPPLFESKLEARYADYLWQQQLAGVLHAYWYQPFSLRLAARTMYTPDFLVQGVDGTLHVHEVKGFWRDDARVKWKVAAALHPYLLFHAITWNHQQGWQCETYGESVHGTPA
jgi:hypothetical protein